MTRNWWIELPANASFYNFIWKPCSGGINFDSLHNSTLPQMINHFEYHSVLSQKSNLFLNMQEYSEVLFELL